jgi:hypothetical protein
MVERFDGAFLQQAARHPLAGDILRRLGEAEDRGEQDEEETRYIVWF